VLGLFGFDDEVTAFMIVNRSYGQRQTARLHISNLPRGSGIQEYDRTTREWRGYATGRDRITVELKPGDGRLFTVGR